MKDFNDNLEIEGDLRDEYDAIQEAEKKTVLLSQLVSDLIDKVWTDIDAEIRDEEDFNDWCIDQEKD